MQELLTISEVCEIVQLKRWAIYHNIRNHNFPEPIKLNARVSRWDRELVLQWIKRCGADK